MHLVPRVVAILLLSGCAGSAPTSDQPPAVTATDSTAASVSVVEPPPVASVTAAPSAPVEPPPPPPRPLVDIADDGVAAELDPGAALIRSKEWSKAKKSLSAASAAVTKRALLHELIVLHALTGRAAIRMGDSKTAEGEFGKVRDLWANADGAKTLDAMGGSEAEATRRKALALTAAGEALFFFAEAERAKAEKEKAPAYVGNGDQKDVQKFLQTKFREWMEKRRKAMAEVDKRYQRILGLQPAPPPAWVVAAAQRSGAMRERYVDDLMHVPLPKDWKGPKKIAPDLTGEELRVAFLQKLTEVTEPDRQAVRAAYKTCADLARKYDVKGEFADLCNTWVSQHPQAPP